jgi:hypothetical protein
MFNVGSIDNNNEYEILVVGKTRPCIYCVTYGALVCHCHKRPDKIIMQLESCRAADDTCGTKHEKYVTDSVADECNKALPSLAQRTHH